MMDIRKAIRLYLVTDELACRGRDFYDVIEQAVKGGVTMVQLREKELGTKAFIDRAFRLKEIVAPYNVPLIINDRVDVALAVDADGVHVGQSDMPLPILKKLLPPGKIIGLSAEKQADVIAAETFDISYLAASPLFATMSKTDTEQPWGLDGLSWIREQSRHPLVVIGGLNENNIQSALDNGAEGIALISAICSAPSPYESARALFDLINSQSAKP